MTDRIVVHTDDIEAAQKFTIFDSSGIYPIELDELEDGESEKGPYWTAWFKVTEGLYAGERLRDIFVLPRGCSVCNDHHDPARMCGSNPEDKKRLRVRELKRAFRLWAFLEAAQFKWNATDGFAKEDLLGLKVRCSVTNEVYQGVERSRPETYYKV